MPTLFPAEEASAVAKQAEANAVKHLKSFEHLAPTPFLRANGADLSALIRTQPLNRLDWWKSKPALAIRYAGKVASFHEPDQEAARYAAIVKDVMSLRQHLRKLAKATTKGNRRSLSRGIYTRQELRRAGVYIAAYHSDRCSISKPCDLQTANALAQKVGLLWGQKEPVRYAPKPKSDGSKRATFSFGKVRYTQQILLSLICDTQTPGYKYDFACPGSGGIHAAALAIHRNIHHAGCRFWAVADIKNAYPTISKRIIRKLFDLPKEVLRYIAVPTKGVESGYCTYHGYPYNHEGPQQKTPGFGLPQGGAHSAVILSAMWSAILRQMPKENAIALIVYADNIAIGAQTDEAARAAVAELRAAFLKFEQSIGLQPGGLMLHEVEVCDARCRREPSETPKMIDGLAHLNSVEFCGYMISVDRFTNKTYFRPSGRAWKKFWRKLISEVGPAEIEDFEAFKESAKNEWKKWRGGFRLWKKYRDSDWNEASLLTFELSCFDWHEAIEQAIAHLQKHSLDSDLAAALPIKLCPKARQAADWLKPNPNFSV